MTTKTSKKNSPKTAAKGAAEVKPAIEREIPSSATEAAGSRPSKPGPLIVRLVDQVASLIDQ